jgi:hypothetical protein
MGNTYFIPEFNLWVYPPVGYIHSPAKKNGTLISQQQIIPIIPILMYFDQEAMIANITLNIMHRLFY